MKKISIIIPCYNVANDIDQCLESLANQTIGIDQLEIILVNDASTDDSFNILCQWEARYPNSIMVINCEKNGGPGQARNIGISYASADYIGFADDDDVCRPEMFEVLYHNITENDCDIAICSSVKQTLQYEDIMAEEYDTSKDEILEIRTDKDRLAFLDRDIKHAVWNKLYKKSIILDNNLFFPTDTYYEDIFFTGLLKCYCNKIHITKRVLYHHISKVGSISANNSVERRLQYIEVYMFFIEELRRRGIYDRYQDFFDELFFDNYFKLLLNLEIVFGIIDPACYHVLLTNTKQLFPNIKQIPIINQVATESTQQNFRLYAKNLLS